MIRQYAAIILLTGIFCIAAAPPPTGWRIPDARETKQDWRDTHVDRYILVRADLNGDGIEDEVRLLVKNDDEKVGLFAFVSEGKEFKQYLLDVLDNVEWLDVMGIDLAQKGKYKTACGKGYFECAPNDQEQITLDLPAINYFKEGGANSFFYWDVKNKRFTRTWMSD